MNNIKIQYLVLTKSDLSNKESKNKNVIDASDTNKIIILKNNKIQVTYLFNGSNVRTKFFFYFIMSASFF